jgi:hypothetical protein
MPTKISGRDKRKQNKTEQNEEEFLLEAFEENPPPSYPIFKPVSSPDFQIAAAIGGLIAVPAQGIANRELRKRDRQTGGRRLLVPLTTALQSVLRFWWGLE